MCVSEECSLEENQESGVLSRRDLLKGGAALLACALLPMHSEAARHHTGLSTAGAKRLYIAADDHTDYMWTANEEQYRQAFLDMLDYYLDLADAYAGEPSAHQSRWNCDGSFWLWTYEKNKPAADFQRLIDRIRSGHISVPLNALCVCLGGAPAEAVLRGMYYPGQIERRHALNFTLAYTIENQTQPYGLVSLWVGAGARYSWKGICGCATQVPSPGDREHEIYWWVGPDGNRMLMKWYSLLSNQSLGGYAEAFDPFTAVELLDSKCTTDPGYNYQIAGAFGHGWDGFRVFTTDFVQAAKSKTDADRLVIVSNEVDFFEDFEATYGAELPTVACSFGNEWDLYCASMAEVSSRVKRSVEKLRGAEALATLVSLEDPDFMDGRQAGRDQAWMNLGLYWEHDWTADGSVSREARRDWQRRLAGEIKDYVDPLHADAARALGGMIQKSGNSLRFYAFNPLSWTRTDLADLPYDGTTPVHVVDVSSGQQVPSQLVTLDGQPYLRVLAQDVPAIGYKVFEVRLGVGQSFPGAPTADAGSGLLENDWYRLTVSSRGAITSLIDKMRADREFAGNIGGYYINDLGSSSGTLAVENPGQVSVTLRATAADPPAHTSSITLIRNSLRIDIRNEITENFGDIVTWKYGFNLTAPDVWHEEVGAVIRAKLLSDGGHYSPRNARYDWLTLNHFADMSGTEGVGVTLSNADCYFMKLGSSWARSLDVGTAQISPLAGGQVDGPSFGIPAQGGDTHFLQRFALQTHDAYDPVQAMKFALEHQNPLITGEVTGGSAYPETSYSLLTISNPRVLLWALKPADDGLEQGIIARLWNLSGSPVTPSLRLATGPIEEASHVSHIETPIAAAEVVAGELAANMDQHQIKTFSIVPTGVSWEPLAPPAGVSASDGLYAHRILVTWNAVEGATSYEVWRHTVDDPGSATRIAASVATTLYSDLAAVPEQLNYYWVKARNFHSTSDFSAPDTGWRRLAQPTDGFIYLPIVIK
jgi:alpha-mannosidase